MKQNKILAEVATFLYHEVTDNPSKTGFQDNIALSYRYKTEEFDGNLNQIALSPAKPTLVNKIDFTHREKFLLLTFDDGGRSARYVADQIERRGWKGHFFIPTSFIDNKCFLSKQGIIELHLRGHIIGSHSHSHPRIFENLSFGQMYEEWRISLDILTSIIQDPIVCASIPNGRPDLNTKLSAQKAGIKFLFTSEPTFTPWKVDEMMCLGRICPMQGTPLKEVRNLAQFKGYKCKFFIQKTKNLIKKIIYLRFVKGKRHINV